MEALALILILTIEFGIGGIVWNREEEPGLFTLAALALVVVATLALFAALGDLSEFDGEFIP